MTATCEEDGSRGCLSDYLAAVSAGTDDEPPPK